MIGQTAFSITASDILEYLYCPRFIYFENYLDIPQHQEKRFKVQKGRDVHDDKQRINPAYLRKKLGCIERKLKGIEPLDKSLLFYRILDLIGFRAINRGSILSELETFSEYCVDNNLSFLEESAYIEQDGKNFRLSFSAKNY